MQEDKEGMVDDDDQEDKGTQLDQTA